MRRFIIAESEADLTSYAGLGLIGMALNEWTNLVVDAETVSPLRSDAMPHASLLSSYIALLCLGKSDFEAIDGFREDEFFLTALGIDQVPSEGILRQRMDANAAGYQEIVERAAIEFLRRSGAQFTPLDNGLVPLDCDVTPFDNSKTKKEGVSRSYKGMDGYAPMAAYLGQEGYCLELELRAGKQHCQKDTPEFLQRVIARARQLTTRSLLLRLDGGNDAIENIAVVAAHNEHDEKAAPVQYVIKWNPRQESPEKWLAYAEEHGDWSAPRAGKRVALFDVVETRIHDGYEYRLRRVMRVIERTIDKHGQRLLVPEIEIEGWWTSLWYEEETIIALYADHGTSEQFHSEFKTDLDIERLPSGKFATNALILACAVLAYNMLRWTERPAWSRCPATPSRQAPAHPHRDAGADVSGRAAYPHRPTDQARFWLRLPRRPHLSATVRATGMYLSGSAPPFSLPALECGGNLLPSADLLLDLIRVCSNKPRPQIHSARLPLPHAQ